jgi:hypothetical protein
VSPSAVGPAAPVDAGTALLRAGTWPALGAAVLVAVASAGWGWRAVVAAALGGVLATAALAVGPVLLHAVRDASPLAVTAAGTGGYAAVVVVLGLVFMVLAPASWLSAEHLAAALVVVTLAGIAGQARAVTRLRVLVFDPEPVEREGGGAGARDGDAPQSCRNQHR